MTQELRSYFYNKFGYNAELIHLFGAVWVKSYMVYLKLLLMDMSLNNLKFMVKVDFKLNC